MRYRPAESVVVSRRTSDCVALPTATTRAPASGRVCTLSNTIPAMRPTAAAWAWPACAPPSISAMAPMFIREMRIGLPLRPDDDRSAPTVVHHGRQHTLSERGVHLHRADIRRVNVVDRLVLHPVDHD